MFLSFDHIACIEFELRRMWSGNGYDFKVMDELSLSQQQQQQQQQLFNFQPSLAPNDHDQYQQHQMQQQVSDAMNNSLYTTSPTVNYDANSTLSPLFPSLSHSNGIQPVSDSEMNGSQMDHSYVSNNTHMSNQIHMNNSSSASAAAASTSSAPMNHQGGSNELIHITTDSNPLPLQPLDSNENDISAMDDESDRQLKIDVAVFTAKSNSSPIYSWSEELNEEKGGQQLRSSYPPQPVSGSQICHPSTSNDTDMSINSNMNNASSADAAASISVAASPAPVQKPFDATTARKPAFLQIELSGPGIGTFYYCEQLKVEASHTLRTNMRQSLNNCDALEDLFFGSSNIFPLYTHKHCADDSKICEVKIQSCSKDGSLPSSGKYEVFLALSDYASITPLPIIGLQTKSSFKVQIFNLKPPFITVQKYVITYECENLPSESNLFRKPLVIAPILTAFNQVRVNSDRWPLTFDQFSNLAPHIHLRDFKETALVRYNVKECELPLLTLYFNNTNTSHQMQIKLLHSMKSNKTHWTRFSKAAPYGNLIAVLFQTNTTTNTTSSNSNSSSSSSSSNSSISAAAASISSTNNNSNNNSIIVYLNRCNINTTPSESIEYSAVFLNGKSTSKFVQVNVTSTDSFDQAERMIDHDHVSTSTSSNSSLTSSPSSMSLNTFPK